ncbi:16S rRNA (cytosine(1402)-N(4))-methyltransferase RsmH [Rhizosphaericola mali]|uniref:Ribosomal RNA small subunit methyltransferase H n=1 Tax=Rhizosphaericola mali TaxID=2545455 RepID=A0A5P2G846_9BACT|nr:16S rRNA (cytosine(1402)-N(4))-methyltransferase RsmH [Rhizosphaericola mali]QES90868.1 16S rRNA (cytosine(1402)-N(4))-methyltransferase RsmH [Rhizosphaericola mali]
MSEQNIGSDYHIPVLYYETLDILNIQPDGVYVDCTFGGGGHSRGILERLGPEGRLVAFDQDADAAQNLPEDDRILFVPQNFRYLKRFLRLNGINGVDGILADLGVSSHQFDEGERGFSIRFDGPLDMRMDQNGGKKASDILLEYDAKQLQDMFSNYGEVTNSKTLAQHIVQHRSVAELKTIDSFKGMLQPIIKGNPNKYLAQVFQALRIEVNSELDALKEMLEQIPSVLNTGGVAAIITFHSLEDRLVKIFFKEETFEEKIENPFENSYKEKELKILTKKPIVPSQDELKKNARSRSSKLRAVEKL